MVNASILIHKAETTEMSSSLRYGWRGAKRCLLGVWSDLPCCAHIHLACVASAHAMGEGGIVGEGGGGEDGKSSARPW